MSHFHPGDFDDDILFGRDGGLGARWASPSGFYYGVPAAVATLDRPAYEGAAASNPSIAVDWGFRIKRNWLISGRVGMEWLDSSITDSPIVGDDERPFASLRLSYDEPVFAPLDAPGDESAPTLPFARVRLTSARLDVDRSLALLARNDSAVDSLPANGDLYVDALLPVTPRHRSVA